jgi:hypothetical protein
MNDATPTLILTPGQRGTCNGFPAVVARHYHGNMYEIRVPGGLVCVDASDFTPA